MRAVGFACAAVALAAAASERQDPRAVRRAVESFVARESAGLPGRVAYAVGDVDPALNVPSCPLLDAALPPGGRLWGASAVAVRCVGATPWTVYVNVDVHVWADVVHAAHALVPQRPIGSADVAMRQDDLTALPAGVLTDAREALGKTPVVLVSTGLPLRADLLRAPLVIQQGQPVKLLLQGRGFTVSGEGRALAAAADGQYVQVRVHSGQVVSGLARAGATVEVRP
jgi:flagella basal body P-ring formation protein FlgA